MRPSRKTVRTRGDTAVATNCVAQCCSVFVLHSDSEQVEIYVNEIHRARSVSNETKEKQTENPIRSNFFHDKLSKPIIPKWGVECLW